MSMGFIVDKLGVVSRDRASEFVSYRVESRGKNGKRSRREGKQTAAYYNEASSRAYFVRLLRGEN